MKTSIELITPELAKEYLKRNTANFRNYDRKWAARLAHDMESGKWEENGEAIKIYEDGTIFDGQHRLHAIIISGTPQRMLVIKGISNDCSVADVGKRRSTRDILRHRGADTSLLRNSVIAAGRFMLTYNEYAKFVVSDAKVVEYLEEHESDFCSSADVVGGTSGICYRAGCTAAAYCLIRTGHSTADIKCFFDVVNSGFYNDRYESSPAIVLRNMITGNGLRTGKWSIANNLPLLTITAFLDFEAGKQRYRCYTSLKDAEKLLETVRKMDGII